MDQNAATLTLRAAALEADGNEAALADPLGPRLRTGVRILWESTDPHVTDEEREAMLDTALAQFQLPPSSFLPTEITNAEASARMLVIRAKSAL